MMYSHLVGCDKRFDALSRCSSVITEDDDDYEDYDFPVRVDHLYSSGIGMVVHVHVCYMDATRTLHRCYMNGTRMLHGYYHT